MRLFFLLLLLLTFIIPETTAQNSIKNIQKWPLAPNGKYDDQFKTVATFQTKRKGPVIVFNRTVYDFGMVSADQKVKCEFMFYNKGDGPLLLKSVDAACGCTVPNWSKKPLMPGDSSVITAYFDPSDYAGQAVNKTITVQTYIKENGQDKIITLFIKGNVRKKQ